MIVMDVEARITRQRADGGGATHPTLTHDPELDAEYAELERLSDDD